MAASYAISALTALTTLTAGDLIPVVDVTDFTQAPTGTTKKITVAALFTNVAVTGTVSSTGLATLNSLTVPTRMALGGATVLSYIGLSSAGTIQASTGNAVELNLGAIRQAAANNDVLYGVNVSGSFDPNGKTGTIAYGVRIQAVTGADTNYALYTDAGLARFGGAILPAGGFTGALTPTVTATYDLGTTAVRWNSLYLSAGIVAGGTITAAALAGPLTTAAQPAITSVGTLTSLAVSGSITVAQHVTSSGTLTAYQMKGLASAPTVSKFLGSATFTAALTTASNDISGQIVLTVTVVGSWTVHVTLTSAMAARPFVVVCPSSGSNGDGQLFPGGIYEINTDTGNFYVSGVALTNTGKYYINYHVIG